MHEIRLIDALEGLQSLEDESIDLIITDPAYSSLEKHRSVGTTTRLKSWFPVVPNSYFVPFFLECFRVLKKGTDLYVVCDEETGDVIKPMIARAGFERRKSLIWNKVGKPVTKICPHCKNACGEEFSPGTPGTGYPFRSCWEMILLSRKGHRKLPENLGVRNVLPIPWIKRKGAYPTEKPVDLFFPLIQQSSSVGETILDPFAGSGSVGEAAYLMGRKFIGFDIEQKSLETFAQRKKAWPEIPPLVSDGVPQKVEKDTASVLSFFGKKAKP